MIIESHNRLNDPSSITATRVVVYNDNKQPLFVAVELGLGHFHLARIGDDDFDSLLDMLGIKQTVVVTPLNLNK